MPHAAPPRRRALFTLAALATLGGVPALQAAGPASGPELPSEEVPYVQTPPRVVQRMLQMAELRPGERLWDLGSGDGRIVIAAARDYQAQGVGFEIDPQLIEESRRLAAAAGVSARTRFEQRDLFTLRFGEPDVVTLYLLPDFNLKLRPLLLEQMRPGSRVVSHEWDMGDWRPDEQHNLLAPDKPHGIDKVHKSYLWVIPARVAGRWQLELRPQDGPAQTLELQLEQRYQELRITSPAAHVRTPWSHLRGTALNLRLEHGAPAPGAHPQRYLLRGTVSADGKRWQGTLHSPSAGAALLGQFQALRLD